MKNKFVALLVRWLVLALGVTLATKIVDGITCDDETTLLIVVVLLSFFNAVVRPILVLFTLPFIVLTMGLGLVVINALLFMLVGRLVDGFHVAGFWPAFWGALIVGVTNFIMSAFIGKPPSAGGGGPGKGGGNGVNINVTGRIGRSRNDGGPRKPDPDVIDV
jgi:putative membrane protein